MKRLTQYDYHNKKAIMDPIHIDENRCWIRSVGQAFLGYHLEKCRPDSTKFHRVNRGKQRFVREYTRRNGPEKAGLMQQRRNHYWNVRFIMT